MKMKNLLFLAVVFTVISCSNNGNPEGGTTNETTTEDGTVESYELSAEVKSQDWKLIEYQVDGQEYTLQNNEEITIKFNNDRCFGNGGCNTYSAPYTVKGEEAIEIGQVASTKKMCAGAMGHEMRFFKLLQATTIFRHRGATLLLEGPNGSITFRYRPKQEENEAPEGNQ